MTAKERKAIDRALALAGADARYLVSPRVIEWPEGITGVRFDRLDHPMQDVYHTQAIYFQSPLGA